MDEWNVLCDFNGTIAIEDVTDSLLERFAEPGWLVLEHAWRSGEIGSAECMARQVALLDASREELDEHLDGLRIDPAFPMFVEAVHAAGSTLWVVSDGLDYAVHAILARYQLDDLPVLANRLVQTSACSWRLETPYSDPRCRVNNGHCKCASTARMRHRRHRVLWVGDGTSCFCVADVADYVFAKHRLIEHCRHAGIPHASIVGFADALALLPILLAGRLGVSATAGVPQDSVRRFDGEVHP